MNGRTSGASEVASGGVNTTMSPRWYGSKRGVRRSTRTNWLSWIVSIIDRCWTWNGWATNVWMTKNRIAVRISVSMISIRQPNDRRFGGAGC